MTNLESISTWTFVYFLIEWKVEKMHHWNTFAQVKDDSQCAFVDLRMTNATHPII